MPDRSWRHDRGYPDREAARPNSREQVRLRRPRWRKHRPINDDESHVRNAIARFNQTDFESAAAKERARKKILAAAKKYDIEVDEDHNVAKPAKKS